MDLHIFTVTQSTLLTISVCHVQTSFCGRFSFSNMGCCHSYSWFYSPWDYSTGASKQGFPAVMWNMLMALFHTCRLENKSRKSETIPAFKIPKWPYGSSPSPLQCALCAQFTKKVFMTRNNIFISLRTNEIFEFFFLKQIWNQCVANVATRLDGTVTLSKLVKFPTHMVMPLV